MVVLQLIDSLSPGGAERSSVNIANALASNNIESHLCATRERGALLKNLDTTVRFKFLQKKSSVDLISLWKLRQYVKLNNVTIIHAHSTSYFLASQIKCILPSIKLIWHEHNGDRVNQSSSDNRILKLCSSRFTSIIVVNNELKEWWSREMNINKTEYLPNFVIENELNVSISEREKRIVCLANLREPKNHLNLLRAFKIVNENFPDWELLLMGRDLMDAYSDELKLFIKENGLNNNVKILGLQENIHELLQKSCIGVLSSDSEGLPISLLEYGMAGLAVVTTKAGHCEEVIGAFGKTAQINDSSELASQIISYIMNPEVRIRSANQFRKHIIASYSENAILPHLLEIYRK